VMPARATSTPAATSIQREAEAGASAEQGSPAIQRPRLKLQPPRMPVCRTRRLQFSARRTRPRPGRSSRPRLRGQNLPERIRPRLQPPKWLRRG
jgi:hypothetical protein